MGSMQFPGIWFSAVHPDLVVLFHVLCSVLLLQFTFTVKTDKNMYLKLKKEN